MTTRIPAKYAMSLMEFGQERKPFLMTGCPAVQHDDGSALAGNLDMNFCAVVGYEMRHDDQGAVVSAQYNPAFNTDGYGDVRLERLRQRHYCL